MISTKPTDIRELMRLMTVHRIESLKVSPDGTIEIVKKIHLADMQKEEPEEPDAPEADDPDGDEAVMFYSTNAPKLALREMESRSSNKPEPPKVQ